VYTGWPPHDDFDNSYLPLISECEPSRPAMEMLEGNSSEPGRASEVLDVAVPDAQLCKSEAEGGWACNLTPASRSSWPRPFLTYHLGRRTSSGCRARPEVSGQRVKKGAPSDEVFKLSETPQLPPLDQRYSGLPLPSRR